MSLLTSLSKTNKPIKTDKQLIMGLFNAVGEHHLILYVLSVLFVVALIVSVLMKRYINKFLQQRIAA